MMDCVAEFRLHDIACGDDRAVMIVPRSNGYAVRCVNYRSKTAKDSLRVDYSRHTSTIVSGELSSCWCYFLQEVEYLGRVYGM